MGTGRKIGLVVILIGFCIPAMSFCFVTGYHFKAGLLGSMNHMEIIVSKGGYISAYEYGRIAVPYKYPLAFGILVMFTGAIVTVVSWEKGG